jgi:hypothetical protein
MMLSNSPDVSASSLFSFRALRQPGRSRLKARSRALRPRLTAGVPFSEASDDEMVETPGLKRSMLTTTKGEAEAVPEPDADRFCGLRYIAWQIEAVKTDPARSFSGPGGEKFRG